MEFINCPNCGTLVVEDDIYPSFKTDSLLCCKHCVKKSKHKCIAGTDPVAVYLEANDAPQA